MGAATPQPWHPRCQAKNGRRNNLSKSTQFAGEGLCRMQPSLHLEEEVGTLLGRSKVMTCSNRCRTERRHRAKSKDGAVLAGVSAAAAASAGKKVSKSEEANEDAEDSKEPLEGLESEEGVPAAAESALSEGEALEEGTERDAKSAARKERKAALKAMKRERRAQSPKDKADAKRKPCDKCNRSVDLLVRCRIDVSQKWFMLCGRCWHSVSGGVPDGDSEHPHYKYGGLWKNRAAKVTTPSFAGAKVKADLQTLQDTEAE